MTNDQTFIALQTALVGEYSLERELGRGGMGIVYLAREVVLDRLVAIKALPIEMSARTEIRERFLREARTAAALSHPNIVPIHRVGEANGIPFFVMSFVPGETLGERLRARGPVTPAVLTRLMHDVALALGYAHGRGVIHRDVKPDNIMIEEGSERALVTDFGIARVEAQAEQETAVMGTTHFMSPEQALGGAIDGRSDVYSLGVVGYIAISGRLPFGDLTPIEYAEARANSAAPTIASAATGVTGPLCRVIDRCLERDPNRRFAAAEQVATALDAATVRQRTTLPMPLRVWAATPTPALGAYQWMSVVFGFNSVVMLIQRWLAPQMIDHLFPAFLALTLVPAVPIALFQLIKTRRALKAGYAIADLRFGLRAWIAERREEMKIESGEREPRWMHVLRWLPPALGMVLLVDMAVFFAAGAPASSLATFQRTLSMLALGVAGSFLLVTGMGVPLEPPGFRRRTVGKLQSLLWNSHFGAWLANMLTPKKRGVPESNFRPTELALGAAVDELFAALPPAYREHVGDLPSVGSRLMTDAAWLRSEVQRLEGLREHAHGDEAAMIDPMLTEAKGQLGKAVGALEQMRLELMRLHGGARDTRALTTSLQAARYMIGALARLRSAEDELDVPRKRLAFESRTPSPVG